MASLPPQSHTPVPENPISDRGRGPELTGTRVTVYRIMDFLGYNYSVQEIAKELAITTEQVQAAIDYIEKHRTQVETNYQRILERVNRPNAPEIEARLSKTSDELRQRIRERSMGKGDQS